MHDPIMKFSLDVPTLVQLQAFARQRNQTVASVVRHLINQAISNERKADDPKCQHPAK
jgi:hypothetical protein